MTEMLKVVDVTENPSQTEKVEEEGRYPKELELELPNGKIVKLAPPTDATQLLIGRLTSGEPNVITITYLKSLMYVQELDGQKVLRPVDMIMAQRLCNDLGEQGVDLVLAAVNEYWPPVTISQLKVIKKSY